ncbi:MAG: ribosome recycling factor [candidate division KSB1 bacterium]|nr:ribosome recycling factor [candidate division KSB1 bacterium]MDZ7333566.1 ribosome recycling factor [candidate division KSB1 bacterium]MDZ7357011.1 ribosome recycling factor [candidate division KSB1 bacterium]MDZ7398680.1 ribosome recycling factor [candidate division KSB1 bacterium]
MVKEIQNQAEERMKKAIENLRYELNKIRTGKASPAILDGIKVNYYGSVVPLKQVANISVPEIRLITVQPWDKSMINEIEKAIQKSDLGLTPMSDGHIIRLPIPPLTEERRLNLVKQTKKLGEEIKVSIRNARRDANESLKKGEKDGDISEDDSHRAQDKIQEMTDNYIKKVDEILKVKEQEIMEI